MSADSSRKKTVRFMKKTALPLITATFLICGFLYSRTYTPAWPGDFAAYLGAGYAIAEESNPYDENSAARCLSENGIVDVENLPFLYSPVFALFFSAAKFIGAVWIRRIWFTGLHISFWYGLYLLIKREEQQWKSIALMIILGTILLFTGPYRAAAKWGQVTALLFFSVSLAIYRKRNSAVSGISLSLIPLIKPALFTPLLSLRGRARLFLVAATLFIITVSVAITGFEPWRQFITALHKVSSEWELSIPGNRSLAGNVHRIVGAAFGDSYIREFADHHQERIERAAKVRALSSVITVALILMTTAGILSAIGRSRWKQYYLSEHFTPLLSWISLLITPLAYDHYGLFLLPMLVHSVFTKKPKLYIPAAVAFAYWSLLPNGNTFIADNTILLSAEAIRPILLIVVSIAYARATSVLSSVKSAVI
jgi:hypothetical protein